MLVEEPVDDTLIASQPLLMVSVFYNEFDYATKSTKKKGRTVTLCNDGTSLFDQLRAAVDSTFHKGLDIGVVRPDGTYSAIRSNTSLLAYLSRVFPQPGGLTSPLGLGIRPVFQCFTRDEEIEKTERFAVGSSPKRLFVRSPVPPTSNEALVPRDRPQSAPLAPLTPMSRAGSSRPLTARPISAMTARATPVSTPFDYIAGSLLDDDAISREFRVVSQGQREASRENVLTYLEARYDQIGQPNRFVSLLDSLFKRGRTAYNCDEFAIILLRLSQS